MKLSKIFTLLSLMALLLSGCNTADIEPEYKVDMQEHFMVNDILYWQSSFPSGTMPDTFEYVGDIQEMVGDTPSSNWCSYSLPVGSKIYLDSEKPHQAWIDGERRFCTVDAGRKYIHHNGSLFVHIGNIASLNDSYYQDYRNRWTPRIDLTKAAFDTVWLGETIFEGYNNFPLQELGSNCYINAAAVYLYSKDPNILLAALGDIADVYVKMLDDGSKEQD